MNKFLPLLLLSGCVMAPLAQPVTPLPEITCPTPPPVPKPIWPNRCAEDWYASADLPPCAKDWITDLSAQQDAIAKKRKHK